MGSNGDVPAVPRTNGGFFRPSVNAATTAQTTSTLDSAIEHMRQVLNIDGQEDTSNAERARRVFLDVVPAQNLMADKPSNVVPAQNLMADNIAPTRAMLSVYKVSKHYPITLPFTPPARLPATRDGT